MSIVKITLFIRFSDTWYYHRLNWHETAICKWDKWIRILNVEILMKQVWSTTTRRIKIARFSNGIFSVFSNDKYKKYNTIWSAWEFSKNREQPEVCSSIRLEVTPFQSKDNKRRVVKRDWKKIHPITLQDERQCARWLAFAE